MRSTIEISTTQGRQRPCGRFESVAMASLPVARHTTAGAVRATKRSRTTGVGSIRVPLAANEGRATTIRA
jgi:hypothetical protein